MKTLQSVVALIAFMGLVFLGCSDKPQSPVAPADQLTSQPSSLEKSFIREFTGTMDPTGIMPGGFTKYPDGKMIMRGALQTIVYNVTFLDGGTDLLTGNGVLELNATLDLTAGVGNFWGNLILTPTAPEALGGVWKFTWHGRGMLNASGWTIAVKELGHGKGGALIGIQCSFDHTITAAHDFSTWTGAGEGYIKAH